MGRAGSSVAGTGPVGRAGRGARSWNISTGVMHIKARSSSTIVGVSRQETHYRLGVGGGALGFRSRKTPVRGQMTAEASRT